jgi:hypothetical protein
MLTTDQKLERLEKLGYGCGPGCSCAHSMAVQVTEEQIAEMERLKANVLQLAPHEYRERKKTGPIGALLGHLFGRGTPSASTVATA